ncbi:MAG TPA: bifunctional oligoribonuclease/PAP phosphatase NrnA [Candidatus Hydrogenedentes bacterium]|nr:bifunctional oligoribonuclease/PAP phosphatase NrnA [Candidatus Hydrogenedentota bacterium]HOL77456.1 bifunctional oligoribonuclease/PAP phosphatase NrnA [Candidatus Hydrogenedentota bacterium]HPO86297.1 bifunctional oligoribonuclease/PAP phosphatase NrnA [Candidatus Hydrogenedentota bacterium]
MRNKTIKNNPIQATKNVDLREIVAKLRAASSVAIATHVSPDGDAVGSMLAAANLLQKMGVPCTCLLENPTAHAYSWLPGSKSIVSPNEIPAYPDLILLLDAPRRDRLGLVQDVLPQDATLVVLDHHVDDNPDGDMRLVDASYAATGEIVAELFDVARVPLDAEAALCLYVAIATDTGGFRYASTTARSHRLAARMIEHGVNAAEISQRCFDAMSQAKFSLMARILSRMQFLENTRLAYSEVYPSDLEETGAGAEDINNLINLGRNVEGVQVAILFRGLPDGTTKISVRAAPEFNALRLIVPFGGGGHVGAAGATLAMPLEQARDAVLDVARRLLENSR